jgi:hypothetical protein
MGPFLLALLRFFHSSEISLRHSSRRADRENPCLKVNPSLPWHLRGFRGSMRLVREAAGCMIWESFPAGTQVRPFGCL